MMVGDVLILTEAGQKIGFGHYSRCSALSKALLLEGMIVQMMIYLNHADLEDVNVIETNWLADIESILTNNKFSTVIVDSYLADINLYIKLQKYFKHVVAIDDNNRMTYPCQLLINPNVFFSEMNYSNQLAKCFGGKEYVILRPEFRNQKPAAINKIRAEEILITIGGSDFRKILPIVIRSCIETDYLSINVIDPEGLTRNIENKYVNILPAQDAKSMVQLMQKADIIISGCGQTLHELASLGKATIGICIDVDQEANQEYYLKEGFLQSKIQWNDKDIKDKIKNELEYNKSLDRRNSIVTFAPSLINKNGILNIVSIIKNLS